ncbi:unnamed protein product [Caenorhabditis brenneri]
MSHPIFMGPPTQPSNADKTEYANTRQLKSLISLISQSKNPEAANKAAKNTLQNIHRVNEKRRILIGEMEELREYELELLEYRRVFKIILNQEKAKTEATNHLGDITCALSITAALLLEYYVYHYSIELVIFTKAEYAFYFYLFMYLLTIICIIVTCSFDSHVPHEETLKVSKLEIKSFKNEEMSKMMLEDEMRILDLYTKEVLPLKTQIYTLQNRRIYLVRFSVRVQARSTVNQLISVGIWDCRLEN